MYVMANGDLVATARQQKALAEAELRGMDDRVERVMPHLRGQVMRDAPRLRAAARYWAEVEAAGVLPQTRATGRCTVKGCRVVRTKLVDVVMRGLGGAQPALAAHEGHCPEHGRLLRWNAVKGVRNDAVRCDPRCTGARGHNCECACGGVNHGADHERG